MKVTSADPSPRNRGMLRIHVDDDYAFSMPASIWSSHHLDEKEDWTEAELTALRDTVLHRAAREAAIRYLSMRDRTETGLFDRLQQAGFDTDAAAAAVAEMKVMGYVDDRRYAQRQISDLLHLKAASQKDIRMRLRAKGIADEVIMDVMSEFEQTDEETAYRGLRKKFGKYDLTDPLIEKKAISYLMHRGFGYETIRTILKKGQE